MKEGLARLFSGVASTYDLTNHVLTLGFDIPWRRRAARIAAEDGGRLWLDVCCGPGEMTRNLVRLSGTETLVIGLDFTAAMVAAAPRQSDLRRARFVLADAGCLPFPSGVFDLVTISFATRNLNTDRAGLLERFREIRRILKPGGSFVNLETSQPSSALVRALFHRYVRTFVCPLGAWISKSRPAYAYLAESISRFYDARELGRLLSEAGFDRISADPLFFGVAAVHQARKPRA